MDNISSSVEILKLLKTIDKKLDQIQEQNQELNERILIIEKSSGAMDEHIHWVNSVHETVKTPLYTALNSINSFILPISGPSQKIDIEEISSLAKNESNMIKLTS